MNGTHVPSADQEWSPLPDDPHAWVLDATDSEGGH